MKENLGVCHKTNAEGSTVNQNDVRDGYEEKGLAAVMVCDMVLQKKPNGRSRDQK